MAVIRSSNAQRAEFLGEKAEVKRFDIEAHVSPMGKTEEQALGFLSQWASKMVSNSEASVIRHNGGEEIDVESALDAFGRQFLVADFKPAARRQLWSMCRNRKSHVGQPVVLADSDEDQFSPEAAHIFFCEVPEDAGDQKLFQRICEAKGLDVANVEALALVYLPRQGSAWTGNDGRPRVSMLEGDVVNLLPMVAPLRKGQSEAWYHIIRACVRFLWTEANRPVREPAQLATVPMDDMDEAEYASFLAHADEAGYDQA